MSPSAGSPSLGNVDLDPKPLVHLPLVRDVIGQLYIPDVLHELLPMDPRSRVSDADCVVVMLLNILEGRIALYHMERWLERTDVEVLLGPDCPADAFNDARLAACLDHIAEHGTEEVLTAIVKRYLADEDAPSEYSVHGDTTSITLHGAYDGDHQQQGPRPARGHSKDHRPDLKQLVFGLSLHGAVGIPLTSAMFAGNTSDQIANRLHLDQLADLLPEEDDVTVVGDCKLVDAKTMGQLLLHGFHFVSLVPKSFNVRSELIEEVRRQGEEMPEILRKPGRLKTDPPVVYRGTSFRRTASVGHKHSVGDNSGRETELRYLVVESSQLGKKQDGVANRAVERERKAYAKKAKKATKRAWACAEDAEKARDRIAAKLELHTCHLAVTREEVPAKRERRGRPRKDEVREMVTQFRLVEEAPLEVDDEAVDRLKFHSRHFVLVTDHLDESRWSDARVHDTYRDQHAIEGHTGFRWLKNVGAVAPMLLHTPHRIAALGVVLVLALMVRNYIQFTLRRRLHETKETVPDRKDQPTQKPTAETAFLCFEGVSVVRIFVGDKLLERRLAGLTEAARTVLEMLGVKEAVFTSPPSPIEIRSAPP